jgi:hypothetical protein
MAPIKNLKISSIFARLRSAEPALSGDQNLSSDSAFALQEEALYCLKLAQINYQAALEVNPSFGKSIQNLQLVNSLLKDLKSQTE